MTQPLSIPQAMDLAVQRLQAGQIQQAEMICDQILTVQPNHAGALNLLGVIALQINKVETAVEVLRRAVAINPSAPGYLSNLGSALTRLGQTGPAVEVCRRAVALNPNLADAHFTLALALRRDGQAQSSIDAFRAAIALRPDWPEAHFELGNAAEAIRDVSSAVDAFRQAVSLRPGYIDGWNNLGLALREQRQIDQAIEAIREGLRLSPDHSLLHFNLACTLLLKGDYASAWPEYEWRLRLPRSIRPQREFSQPMWDGTSALDGRRLLVHAEQGLGDTIQFIRFLPLLRQRFGQPTILLQCQPVLATLLGGLPDIEHVIPETDDSTQDFDLHYPLLSLPHLFQITLENLPAAGRYIHSDPLLAEKWRARIDHDERIRIGIAWSGRTVPDPGRSLPLVVLEPILRNPDFRFYSLQKGDAASEARNAPTGIELIDFSDELRDFADTAALIENLDMVISVDTAVAHLAGAMGKPVWTLISWIPDWRWMLDRSDSPWYPTMKLFRQPQAGDWQTPVQQVVQALGSFKIART